MQVYTAKGEVSLSGHVFLNNTVIQSLRLCFFLFTSVPTGERVVSHTCAPLSACQKTRACSTHPQKVSTCDVQFYNF